MSRNTRYTKPITESTPGDLYTIKAFETACKDRSFVDTDGHGRAVRNKKIMTNLEIKPSQLHLIPGDATHIMWYNK